MSQDLGDFFVDMLGPNSVRDARVVMDKGRRSKGYVIITRGVLIIELRTLSLTLLSC
jgi:hypothetical protein